MNKSQPTKNQWLLKASFAACLVSVIAILAMTSSQRGQLNQVLDSGVLRIITRNSPTTYYQDRNQISGFEYELAKAFADDLGVRLEVELAESLDDLISEVESGSVNLAAAGLTVTESRQQKVSFGDSYLQVTQQLIYRTDKVAPRSLQDLLEGNLMVTEHPCTVLTSATTRFDPTIKLGRA